MNKEIKDGELYEQRFGFKERKSNFRFITVLLFLVLLFLSFRVYWTENFGRVDVVGASMNMTLKNGDKLLMKYVEPNDLERGDVIVVSVEKYGRKDNTTHIIKRLIATEGEKVKCIDGNVYLCRKGQTEYDAEPLYEPYAFYRTEEDKLSYDFGEYVVGEGEIFFLGDNRKNSVDSRYNEAQGSYLDCLYKATDVVGVVPEWAIEHKKWINKIFF